MTTAVAKSGTDLVLAGLRQFVVEGFVNRYVCEVEPEPSRIVCESEATEGASGRSRDVACGLSRPRLYRFSGPVDTEAQHRRRTMHAAPRGAGGNRR